MGWNSQKSCGNDGVLPYTVEQLGFPLQEEELREEACCWFSKDALTVPCFKSPSLYIHAIQRVSVWGVGEWGRRGAEPVFHRTGPNGTEKPHQVLENKVKDRPPPLTPHLTHL